MLPRQPRGIEIVAERGANARHLVGSDLLALSAPAKDDAAVGATFGHQTRDVDADRRVIRRLLIVCTAIVNSVPEPRERVLEMFLQSEARMIGANCDAHAAELYYMAP